MRSLIYMGIALLMSQFIASQTLNDVIQLTQSGLNGSARYTGMAGAFGALGGDLTAIGDNPAASSVFLETEIGGSTNFRSRKNEGTFLGTLETTEDRNLYLDQFGIVSVFNNTNLESPWLRISASISVNRIATFDQQVSVNGLNTSGISNYFLHFADGIAFGDIQLFDDETISEIYQYLGDEIGFGAQQAFLGYQSFIIDPVNFDADQRSYISNINSRQYRQDLDYVNTGFHRKTSFNFSALYQNILHLGVSLNAHRIQFSNNQEFFETNQDLESFVYDVAFNNYLSTIGTGISTQFGAILKLKNIRLGLTYDSPQWIEIEDQTEQQISTFRFQNNTEIQETIAPNVTNLFAPYQLNIPSKTSVSLAYVFNTHGLISVDYSTQNLSNSTLSQNMGSSFLGELNAEIRNKLKPTNTLKIGAEYRLKDLSLRAGYFYRTKNQNIITNDDQAITLGFGFDFGGSSINFSLVQFNQLQSFQLFSAGLTNAYEITKNLSQFTLSYNFKL